MTYTHSHSFIGQVSRHICLSLCLSGEKRERERDLAIEEEYRGGLAICFALKLCDKKAIIHHTVYYGAVWGSLEKTQENVGVKCVKTWSHFSKMDGWK